MCQRWKMDENKNQEVHQITGNKIKKEKKNNFIESLVKRMKIKKKYGNPDEIQGEIWRDGEIQMMQQPQ